MDSFIVDFWAKVFGGLGWVSPFRIVRALVPKTRGSYAFVDSWALVHLILPLVALGLAVPGRVAGWEWVLLAYGSLRVFETVVYQANVLLFDEYRALSAGREYAVRGYRRLVVLSLQNYVEVLLWFSFAYRNFAAWYKPSAIELDSVVGALYFAVVTVVTLGYGDSTPVRAPGAVLVTCQALVGLFMTLLILARFIGILRSPATRDPFETPKKGAA